jgi:hypothetical protein
MSAIPPPAVSGCGLVTYAKNSRGRFGFTLFAAMIGANPLALLE